MPKTGQPHCRSRAHTQLRHQPTASNPHQRPATTNQTTENKIIPGRLKNLGQIGITNAQTSC
jgi:hypothetical protein